MKVVRHIVNIISTLMILALLTLTMLLVGVRVIGLTPYAVLSGSMEPAFHVGSLIYVKKIDPAAITEGMPITFVVNKDLLVATHRVVEIEVRTKQYEQMTDENGSLLFEEDGDPLLQEVILDEPAYYFTTKGDANDVIDGAPVYYKNVIGTPVFSVPKLGYFSSWLQTRKGMIVAVSTVLILMILTFLPDLLRMVDDEPQKPAKGKKAAPKKDAPPQKKKSSLTQEERAMIIAGRKARGEELRGPLTQEEKALIIAGRREKALALQQAEAQTAALQAAPQAADEENQPQAAEPFRRRRRRQTSDEEE